MSDAATPSEPAIATRADFHAALAWGFEQAIAQDARRIVCADSDFAEWAWDHQPTLDALAGWLRRPQRRLELLARSYDTVPRRWPRFNGWRSSWAHAITAWQIPEDWPGELPTLLVSDKAVSVHLIDAVHWRGRARLDARTARQWLETCDVVLQRSEATFPVRTLGL
jgi:hypothetical protein